MTKKCYTYITYLFFTQNFAFSSVCMAIGIIFVSHADFMEMWDGNTGAFTNITRIRFIRLPWVLWKHQGEQ